jgi:hypothetical protein
MPLTSGDLHPDIGEQDGAPSWWRSQYRQHGGGPPGLNPAKDGVDEACSGSDPAMGVAEEAAMLQVRSISFSFIPPLYSVSPSTSLSLVDPHCEKGGSRRRAWVVPGCVHGASGARVLS